MADGSIFLQRAKNLFFIALGTLALSFATASFLIPFELVAGGISGVAIAIGSFFEDSVRYTEVVIAMLTWAAFFSGLIFLGKSFALKTLLSSALYPLFISLFIERGASDFLLSLFDFKGGTLLAALLGGAIVGFGCALSFKGGGSTGGVDVLSLIICKKNSKLKIPRVMLFIDSLVIVLAAFIMRDAVKSVLGIFSALSAAFTVEAMLNTKIKTLKINWRDKKIDNLKK